MKTTEPTEIVTEDDLISLRAQLKILKNANTKLKEMRELGSKNQNDVGNFYDGQGVDDNSLSFEDDDIGATVGLKDDGVQDYASQQNNFSSVGLMGAPDAQMAANDVEVEVEDDLQTFNEERQYDPIKALQEEEVGAQPE